VIDATGFLDDHPGGRKAILLYKGRDATEEFNMLHDKSVIAKYYKEGIIGTVKQ
jgi:cytochrome b involved in lipid metabolism